MVFVLCGELDKSSSSKENITSLKAVFGNREADLYIDDVCSRKNKDSVTDSLSALRGLVRLAESAGISLRGLKLSKTDSGKPCFKDSNWQFSISHSGKNFACALSKSRVGIDIEGKQLSDEKAIKTAERFFSPRELEFVGKNPRENFLKVWTAKEAYVKMLGITLSEGLRKADFFSDKYSFYSFEYKGAFVTLCTDSKEEFIIF